MAIIDVHTHFGVFEGGFNMPLEMQLESMKRYNIDYALISNIECGVFHEGIEGNKKMLEIVRENREKLGCVLWCCENLSDVQKSEFEKIYLENKDIVKGLKIHPDIAHKRADDECFDFFYKMAQKYSLPVLVHTRNNEFSAIKFVVAAAKKFKNANFILGHMDISSDDCAEALNAVLEYDNIYGDTAWVWLDAVKKANEMGIAHKMMFGTDAPISGVDTYFDKYYRDYYSFDEDYMLGVMSENARKLFRL